MVGNAADPRARIRTIVAHAQNIRKNVEANLESKSAESENRLILESLNRLEQQIGDLESQVGTSSSEGEPTVQASTKEIYNKIASLEKQIKDIGGRFMAQKTQQKKAYMQGTVEPEVGKTFEMADKNYKQYWEEDKHLQGEGMETGSEGLHPGYGMGSDEEVKKMYLRASAEERKKARRALLEKAAYMQGTVEPDLGSTFEMADKNYKQYWEEDKHLHGEGMESGSEGLHPGYGMGSDEEVKKQLLRAKLKARLEKSANPAKNKWTVYAGSEPVISLTAEQAYGTELSAVATDVDDSLTHQEWFDSKNYGINLIQAVKHLGVEKVAAQIAQAKKVTAQAAPAPAPAAEAPMPEAAPEAAPAEGEEQQEMSAAEGIKAAAERIESAKDEILSLTESLEGAPAAEGEGLAADMGAAGAELGELGTEMGAADQLPPAAASAYKRLTRQALLNADAVLKRAEVFVSKYAADDEEDEEKEDGKGDVEIEVKGADKDDVKVKEEKEAKLTSKQLATRRAARQAYAQQLYNLTEGDMIAEAHPQGGNTTTFPNQEEGKIETVTEAQEKDQDVANSAPRGELVARRKYRDQLIKAAEKIVSADAAQVAKLNTEADDAQKAADEKKKQLADATKQQAQSTAPKTAAADNETKQYYKEMASQSATGQKPDPEVGKFYNELTQDFGKKKSTAAVHDYGLKMKRAYAVALKRANLGQIEATQEAIDTDVDRLMGLDDQSFAAFADVVENTKKAAVVTSQKTKQVRTAGALNVGVDQRSESFTDQLNKLPWK
jgi:hypothetical protein